MSFLADMAGVDRDVMEHCGDPASVLYAAAGHAPVTVDGITFEIFQGPAATEPDAELPVQAVWLLLADLPGDPLKDPVFLTIGGTVYRPHLRDDDEPGGIVFHLHEV